MSGKQYESEFVIDESYEVARRCTKCDYQLEGLASDTCPECGSAFSFEDVESFTNRPKFAWWVFWFPPVVLGLVVLNITTLCAGLIEFSEVGIQVSFSVGAIIFIGLLMGYRVTFKTVAAYLVSCSVASIVLFTALIFVFEPDDFSLRGPMVLIKIILFLDILISIGIATGIGLRAFLKRTGFAMRGYLA